MGQIPSVVDALEFDMLRGDEVNQARVGDAMDTRRLEVVVDGLPLFGRCQLAVVCHALHMMVQRTRTVWFLKHPADARNGCPGQVFSLVSQQETSPLVLKWWETI